MNDYLYLFRGGGIEGADQSPELLQEHMEKWKKWMMDLQKEG